MKHALRTLVLFGAVVATGCSTSGAPSGRGGSDDTAVATDSAVGDADTAGDDASPDTARDTSTDLVSDAPTDVPADVLVDAPGDADALGDPIEEDPDAFIDAADADSGDADAGTPPEAGRPPHGEPVELFIAAHQDDDLLFMSPDLLHALRAGRAVRTVFVTAGDACGTRDPAARARGIRAAYTWMTDGVADPELLPEGSWRCGPERIAGVAVEVCERAAEPHMSLVFVRLPDCAPALNPLLGDGSVETVSDPPVSLTREDLVSLLVAELRELRPSVVHALDASGVYGLDNEDHTLTAGLAYESARWAEFGGRYREHRSYNVQDEPLNVAADDLDAKWEAMVAYCGPALEGEERCTRGSGVPFWEWARRQVPVERVEGVVTRLGIGGRCLGRVDGGVGVTDCAGAASFEGWAVRAGEDCLRAYESDGAGELEWGPCGGVTSRVTLFTNGQLRAGNGRCLELAGDEVRLSDCRGEGEPHPRQSWTVQRVAEPPTGLFSDEVLAGAGQRSFGLADVDGDGRADACIRTSAGAECAIADDGAGFAAPALWSPSFSDEAGWSGEARDGTLRFADLTGDGRADVCGRGYRGMLCAHSNGERFIELDLWSAEGAFGDEEGAFWFGPSHWGSIGLPDLRGDGRADLCGRYADGVHCAEGTGAGFDPTTPWLTDEFTDSAGWAGPGLGATLRYGDIDGDGLSDVCGRGVPGVFCALGGPTGFESPRFWGYRDQLADAAGWPAREQFWASLALVDVNADGRADLCIRGPEGVACAWSTGTTFARAQLVGGFADSAGFGTETHGGSVRWGDIDGDGIADACARAPGGVSCATSRR